jgi:hypothetical protein
MNITHQREESATMGTAGYAPIKEDKDDDGKL